MLQAPRQPFQSAACPAKNHLASHYARRIIQRTGVTHDEYIRPRVVRHAFYSGQLCQSRLHITRSTPLADHARHFNDGGFAIIAEDLGLRIDPDIT